MDNFKKYIGKKITVTIDRKMGSKHPKWGFIYPNNYGYIPNTISGDGEELDAYVLGVFEPVESFEGICIAVLHRLTDDDDKLIVVPEDVNYTDEQINALTEYQERFFKHIIEDCDGYKNLYTDGKQIAKENDLQRLFRFVWYGTSYKVDAEPNNGRGQADFIVSMGQNNQNIVEFKLASNSTLSHVFTQVKIYEAANCTDGSLIAIFCFSESEYLYSEQVVKAAGYEELLGESIYLIDCRNDNKKSASIA